MLTSARSIWGKSGSRHDGRDDHIGASQVALPGLWLVSQSAGRGRQVSQARQFQSQTDRPHDATSGSAVARTEPSATTRASTSAPLNSDSGPAGAWSVKGAS